MSVDCFFFLVLFCLVYQSLPIGVMGLVLAYRRRPSSFLVRANQVDYVRLLSVMDFCFASSHCGMDKMTAARCAGAKPYHVLRLIV